MMQEDAAAEVHETEMPGNYRVTSLVANLGWVDLDLGCSTTLLGQ